MTESQFGFMPHEVDAEDTITLVAAHWHEPQSKKPAWTDYLIGTYGIVYAGRGTQGELWGGGPIAGYGWPIIAQGIIRAIREQPLNVSLVIHAHADLWRYVLDYAQMDKNQHRPDFASFRELLQALEGRAWFKPECNPRSESYRQARDLAETAAFRAVRKYRQETCPSFCNATEGASFAYETPVPFSIVSEGP
jgi:hypothetical protein